MWEEMVAACPGRHNGAIALRLLTHLDRKFSDLLGGYVFVFALGGVLWGEARGIIPRVGRISGWLQR